MRTIIAGGRDFDDYDFMVEALSYVESCGWSIHEVVCGTARGADTLGEAWGRDTEKQIERFIAQWDKFGKRAGYLRNADMAEYAEALVAFWDGKSKGTKHMIDTAVKKGLYVKVFNYK